ncbi:DUF2945 domain-containing protein [Cyclobacterium amurskyense]|uniref:DUF2945 domain-containing protein n=1 Tax=Cyclobacterium amurskyense TaxID=320787 RepID=UPI003C6D8A01
MCQEQSVRCILLIFDYKGYTHHAIEEEPQYELKSSKTNYIAAHKGKTLKKKP